MEQQQQQQIHGSILNAIARLTNRHHRKERHKLIVSGYDKPRVDRLSLQHLVDSLDDNESHEVVITELELSNIRLIEPPDGGLQVLRDFFSRNNNTTTLTKVTLHCCHFGNAEDTLQLLAAFERNRTIMDLTLARIDNLFDNPEVDDVALGARLSGLMQTMPQLQRLDCHYSCLRVEGVRAFQPALQVNQTLRALSLWVCQLGDEGIRVLADALVGNTTIEILNITGNYITSNGLPDITRILDSTRLKKFILAANEVFGNEASTWQFAQVLSRHEFLKELNLCECHLGDGGIRLIADALVGNTTIDILNISCNGFTSDGLTNITTLLESTQLKNICFAGNDDLFHNEASTKRFAHVLSRHEFLKELNLSDCQLGDGGIRLIVDGLVGNTNMEVLDIDFNLITSKGLADITRLLESTQLHTIKFQYNKGVFDDANATQHFVSTLQHKKSSVQELPEIDESVFPEGSRAATSAIINNSLTRNQQLNRVDWLLAPQQQQQQQQRTNNAASMMMLKTWHKAITKFAMVPNNAGASAIFKLFQARPQLLEKRLKRPAEAAVASFGLQNVGGDGSSSIINNQADVVAESSSSIISRRQKCQRLQ